MPRKPRPEFEPPRESRLLKRADAARLCEMTTVRFRELVRNEGMPAPVKHPAGDRWRLGELESWIAARRAKSPPASDEPPTPRVDDFNPTSAFPPAHPPHKARPVPRRKPRFEPPRELRLLNLSDAAAYCQMSAAWFREMELAGQVPRHYETPMGDRWRLGELEVWLRELPRSSPRPAEVCLSGEREPAPNPGNGGCRTH